ncbi:MAG: hypothetical protein KAW61_07235, partial [candidate division Zixibacteria bacterium]|nr:hypothetical protein [candidate division Zixibacteria bacterium]
DGTEIEIAALPTTRVSSVARNDDYVVFQQPTNAMSQNYIHTVLRSAGLQSWWCRTPSPDASTKASRPSAEVG